VEVAFQRDNFNCRQCRHHRHCDDSNPAPFPMFAVPEIGLESRTCLLPMITPFSHQLMRLYSHYKNQLLPFAGGLHDQPAIWMEAMEVIDAHQARVLSEKSKQSHV
jgi:hypothetical protein